MPASSRRRARRGPVDPSLRYLTRTPFGFWRVRIPLDASGRRFVSLHPEGEPGRGRRRPNFRDLSAAAYARDRFLRRLGLPPGANGRGVHRAVAATARAE
jgi:hypothetical protein